MHACMHAYIHLYIVLYLIYLTTHANNIGPLSMAPSQLGCFTHSSPDQPRPNIQYHIQPLSLDKFGEPLHSFGAITASVCNLRPTSRGSIEICSANAAVAPCIKPNYLSTPEDRRVAIDSIYLTRKIMNTAVFREFLPEEYLPGREITTETDLVHAAGAIGTTIFHPCGTCKMGPKTDLASVVDSSLRVHGMQGLRVVDASIMPMITSGNPCAPVVMIAEKAADIIISYYDPARK